MSPKYGEVIAQCNARYNIPYEPQLVSQIEKLFGDNCAKPSNRTTRVREQPKYGNSI